jgi:hypothetical protein
MSILIISMTQVRNEQEINEYQISGVNPFIMCDSKGSRFFVYLTISHCLIYHTG